MSQEVGVGGGFGESTDTSCFCLQKYGPSCTGGKMHMQVTTLQPRRCMRTFADALSDFMRIVLEITTANDLNADR